MVNKVIVVTGENRVSNTEVVLKAADFTDMEHIISFPESKPKWLHSINLKTGLIDKLKDMNGNVSIATYSYSALNAVTEYCTDNNKTLNIYIIDNDKSLHKVQNLEELKGKVF